jgi:polysaccharide chain length determinant protein (PEP-CTERM system associated)
MLGHRDLTMRDYVGILKRRYLLILICAIVLFAIATGVSFTLPPRYVSQTLVIIEQQKVPEDYVKPVVNEDLGARLSSMKEQILSRSRLEPIIERFNLFGGGKSNMDDRIDQTRKAIKIAPIQSGDAHGMPGFFISFQASDARTAQQVCGEITSLFVSENVSAREASAEGTTDFLKQQLSDAKRNLDDQEARLATFQQKNVGRLPDQQAPNMASLQALTTQLDAATQSVNRMQQDETFLSAMISQEVADQQRTEPTTGVSVDTLQTQLQALIAQKAELEAQYTSDYPDVVAVARKIADLQAKVAHAAAHPTAVKAPVTSTHPDSPQLQQTKAQLRALQQSIVSEKQQQGALAQQVRMYQSRVESRPMVEQEFQQVTRDHQTALDFYNSLLKKMNDSSMATALEQHQQGEQFQVMDAPNLPEAPTFPNHSRFAIGGLMGGLFLGLAISALLEYRDTALRTEADIWAFTKLPTLAVVSHLEDLPQRVVEHSPRKLFSRKNKPLESARG